MKVVLVEAYQRCCWAELLLLFMSQRMMFVGYTYCTVWIHAGHTARAARAARASFWQRSGRRHGPTSTLDPHMAKLYRSSDLVSPDSPALYSDHISTHLTFHSAESLPLFVFHIAAISTSFSSDIRIASFLFTPEDIYKAEMQFLTSSKYLRILQQHHLLFSTRLSFLRRSLKPLVM